MNHESNATPASSGSSIANHSMSKLGDLGGFQLIKWALALVFLVAIVCTLIVALQHSMAIGAVILFVLVAASTALFAGFWFTFLVRSYLIHRDWQAAVVQTREQLGQLADRLMPASPN